MNKEELYSRLDELSWTDSILDALDATQSANAMSVL